MKQLLLTNLAAVDDLDHSMADSGLTVVLAA
jgi:hypothetical protein